MLDQDPEGYPPTLPPTTAPTTAGSTSTTGISTIANTPPICSTAFAAQNIFRMHHVTGRTTTSCATTVRTSFDLALVLWHFRPCPMLYVHNVS